MAYYIGVMTGTSCDQVDSVLLDIQGDDQICMGMSSVPISSDLRQKVHALCDAPQMSLGDLLKTERALAKLVVESVDLLLNKMNLKPENIEALGVHGQTIFHMPDLEEGYSFQLGDFSWIAAKTKIRTIGDFRRQDIALGGRGCAFGARFSSSFGEEG